MSLADSTCWGMLDEAARGSREAQSRFAERYEPIVRSYLGARWHGGKLIGELDDAVQDVFVECLRSGGVLEKASADRPGGFRAFLFGLVRNVARRVEGRYHERAQAEIDPDAFEADEDSLSRVFDRAWAKSVMREAAERQRELASQRGPEAKRRLDLLRLRFEEDLPIRDIARLWHADVATLHRDYSKAREEFRSALMDVLATHLPTRGAALESECSELLALLA
jgi:RNA polymerase sigma factor (sigma-70 family)